MPRAPSIPPPPNHHSALTLDDKIEATAQELARMGVPIERARSMLIRAVYAPPTAEEIEEVAKELQRPE